jgi:hypothetical protein
MTRQRITGHRLATIEELRMGSSARHDHSNARQRAVDWQFKIDVAQIKLKSVYPSFEV